MSVHVKLRVITKKFKPYFSTGGDNSNKRCFGTKPKLFRESGDFSGNRDTWEFFRETRDNSGTMQKKIGTSGNVSPKFGRMIQISGTTKLRRSIAQTAFVRVVTPRLFSKVTCKEHVFNFV